LNDGVGCWAAIRSLHVDTGLGILEKVELSMTCENTSSYGVSFNLAGAEVNLLRGQINPLNGLDL
jgi:hypothetical protein